LLKLVGDPDWRVRCEVVRALGSEVDAGGEPVARPVDLPVLVRFLEDPNPNVRVVTAEVLASAGDRGHAIGVLLGLIEAPDPRLAEVGFTSLVARLSTVTEADSFDVAAAVGSACEHLLASPHWTCRAAVVGAVDLLPDPTANRVLETLLADDGRVAKLAVGPYLERRARAGEGEGSLWDRIGPALPELRAHRDPMVRLMTVYGVAGLVDADSVYHPTLTDRDALDELLAATYREARQDPALTDLREAAVDVASSRTDRVMCRALLETACGDDDYGVRRAAVSALEAAGGPVPRTAEPVETGRSPRDYRHIVRWANQPHEAIVDTEAGRIQVRLFSREAPLTVWSFAQLANQGFYDDGAWHRVVPNFVLQDGCPRGDGWGGPHRRIRCEINHRDYTTGRMGMALSGKDTGGSQFFFTHSPQPHLDGRYTVFGEIVEGHEVADLVTQGLRIRSIRVLDLEVEG
jgi:peptidyl-prolyl cis-trans isomerase B (cyclophilin B)